MIKDFCLHKTTYKQFLALISDLILGDARYRVNVVKWQDRRTIPMNSTWRMWMEDTAKHLTKSGWGVDVKNSIGLVVGQLPFSADDCHEFFVNHYAGQDASGNRVKTSKMDKGPMLDMMNRHQQWCMRNNVKLRIPEDCEYMQLRDAV